jgi:hypothetical protein
MDHRPWTIDHGPWTGSDKASGRQGTDRPGPLMIPAARAIGPVCAPEPSGRARAVRAHTTRHTTRGEARGQPGQGRPAKPPRQVLAAASGCELSICGQMRAEHLRAAASGCELSICGQQHPDAS